MIRISVNVKDIHQLCTHTIILTVKLWCVTFWANRSFTAFVLLALSIYLHLIGHLQAYRLLGSSSPCICTQSRGRRNAMKTSQYKIKGYAATTQWVGWHYTRIASSRSISCCRTATAVSTNIYRHLNWSSSSGGVGGGVSCEWEKLPLLSSWLDGAAVLSLHSDAFQKSVPGRTDAISAWGGASSLKSKSSDL